MGEERILASLAQRGEAAAGASAAGVYVVTVGEAAYATALGMTQDLRRRGLRAGVDLERRSLKGQMRQANRDGYRFAVILGSEELERGRATVKDLATGEQVVTVGQLSLLDGDTVTVPQNHAANDPHAPDPAR